MALPEILQMCCLGKRSGQMTFSSGDLYGYVYFQHGQAIHADYPHNQLEGEEAIYAMLQLPSGTFSFDESILPHKRTISASWEQLLLEGARRADSGFTPDASGIPTPSSLGGPPQISSSRIQGGVPRVTIVSPQLPSETIELTGEFTHVGRVDGNEIILPDVSVSSRHCMFILSGQDVILRDLNSSNGTFINGEQITESVLQLGDMIQCGSIALKFESSVKRPKLSSSPVPQTTMNPRVATAKLTSAAQTARDASFLEGKTAIAYHTLAAPEPETKKSSVGLVVAVLVILIVGGAAAYFFLLK